MDWKRDVLWLRKKLMIVWPNKQQRKDFCPLDDNSHQKKADTWYSGSLDPSDCSKGGSVASTKFFFYQYHNFLGYEEWKKLRHCKK